MAIKLTSVKQDNEMEVAESLTELSALKTQLAELKKHEKFLIGIIQRTMGDQGLIMESSHYSAFRVV